MFLSYLLLHENIHIQSEEQCMPNLKSFLKIIKQVLFHEKSNYSLSVVVRLVMKLDLTEANAHKMHIP